MLVTLRRRCIIVGSTDVGATTGVLATLRTITGTVSGASSSAAAALFLAVACDKRTKRGGATVRQDTIYKIEAPHTGTRLAVETLHLCQCADLISLARESVAQRGKRRVSGGTRAKHTPRPIGSSTLEQ